MKILLVLAITYLGVLVFLFFKQDALFFHPQELDKAFKFSVAEQHQEININTADGVVLNNLLIKSQNSKGLVIFFHGNAGNIEGWSQGHALYTQANWDILYCDYRGFGKSEGKTSSSKNLYNDAQLVFDSIKTNYSGKKIISSGTSIGTAIASHIALKNKEVSGLILSSPYESLKKLAKQKVAIIPKALIKYDLSNMNNLKGVDCPTLLLHGSSDKLIPSSHAANLKSEYPRLDLVLVEGAGHNDLSGTNTYNREVRQFLNTKIQ